MSSPEFIRYDNNILEPAKELSKEYEKEKLKKYPYQAKLDKMLNQINKINEKYEKYRAMTYDERLNDFRKKQLSYKNSPTWSSPNLEGEFALAYQYYVDGLIKGATTQKHFNKLEKIMDDWFIPAFQTEYPKVKSTLKLFVKKVEG
jgi:hypothetical protein